MRTTTNISITIPPNLLKEAVAVAKREGRTQSELVREALRRYISQQEFDRLTTLGRKRATAMGLKPSDVNHLVKEYRTEKTAKGL